MKLNKFCLASLALAAVAFVGCKNEDVKNAHHFDNRLYISSPAVDSDLLIKDDQPNNSRSIATRTAKTAETDITVTFEAKPSQAAQYNLIYGDKAIALPAENYELPDPVSLIKTGNVFGNEVVVNFLNTNTLDRNKRYVLPVSIASATNVDVLESARTIYYVFKGAALINVVASVAEMYFPVNWASGVNVTNLKTITVEALLRSSDWTAGRSNALSTIFGIEGGDFLLRVGDGDRPRNQLQMVTPAGKWPAPNAVQGLPVNEWVHIAVVYDATTSEMIYYLNGKSVASDKSASGTISLDDDCYIGKSWDDTRWLPGEISEVRVWNIQRTAEQIAASPYYVDPTTPGLLAYWRFNEGVGKNILDATGHGTNLTAEGGIPKWVPVSLPAIAE